MAADARVPPMTNGTHDTNKPIELSIGLPHSPGTRIYLHLTILATHLVLFVTNANVDAGQTPTALGSFVYAMPDVSPPSSVRSIKDEV